MQKIKSYLIDLTDLECEVRQCKNAAFYTTDTEAILKFELTDDVVGGSAVISFYHLQDGSTVQIDAAVEGNEVTVELSQEFLAHQGT